MIDAEIKDALERAEAERLAAKIEQLRTAVANGNLVEETVTREYAIPDTDDGDRRYVRVKLSRTVFFTVEPGTGFRRPDPDNEPFDDAKGYAYTLTAKGQVSRRDAAYWRSLPAELVALFLPATTPGRS